MYKGSKASFHRAMPGTESEAMFYGLAAELKRQYSPSAVKGKGQAASRTGGPVRDPAALVPPPPDNVRLPACLPEDLFPHILTLLHNKTDQTGGYGCCYFLCHLALSPSQQSASLGA